MQKRFVAAVIIGALLLSVALTGCGGGSTKATGGDQGKAANPTSPGTSTPAPKPFAGVKLTIAYPSAAGYADAVGSLAWKKLQDLGMTVDTKFMSTSDLAIKTVTQGDAQIGITAAVNVISAVQNADAPLKIFLLDTRNEWSLVAKKSITDPKDLNGVNYGIHSPKSMTSTLTNYIAEKYKVQPKVRVVPGSDVRAQALLKGQLDATLLEAGDMLTVLNEKPNDFHVLLSIAKELPTMQNLTYFARADWLQKNPKVAGALVKAYLEAVREVYVDPGKLNAAMAKLFPDQKPQDLTRIGQYYVDQKIFDPNGSMTKDSAIDTMKFLILNGAIKGDANNPDYSKYYDFSVAEPVLKEIGSK